MSVSIVWLDHQIAKIYHFSEDRMERKVLRLDEGDESTDRICLELEGSKQVLVLSPSDAGTRLVTNIARMDPELGRRVVGCETLASADDASVAVYATKYFRKPVRMG